MSRNITDSLNEGIRYERGGVAARAKESFLAVTKSVAEHPAAAAEAWWRLANLHRLHSSWEEALDATRQCIEIATAHKLDDVRANALNIEGAISWNRGDYEQSRELFTQSLASATTAATRAKALQNLGGLAAEQGNLDEGERLLGESREQYRAAGDGRGEANSLLNLGRLQSDRGDHMEARATLESAAAGARLSGDLEMYAAALLNLGIVLGALGHISEAEERITTAYGQFTIAEIPAARVRCLMELATLAARRAERDAARVCLEHARGVATSAGLRREEQLIGEQLAALADMA